MSEVVKTRAVTALLYGQNARVDYESAVKKKQTKKKNKQKNKTKEKAIPRLPPPPPFPSKKKLFFRGPYQWLYLFNSQRIPYLNPSSNSIAT